MHFDRTKINVESMKQAILERMYCGVVQTPQSASTRDIFTAVAKTVLEWMAK